MTDMMSGMRFNVLGKIMEDGLPPLTLLLHGVLRFSIKRDAHRDTIGAGHELDRTNPVAK
jgi:hypothetical protein